MCIRDRLWTTGGSLAMQLLIVYFGPLQRIFLTDALSVNHLLYLLGMSITGFGIQECRRIYERYLDDHASDTMA